MKHIITNFILLVLATFFLQINISPAQENEGHEKESPRDYSFMQDLLNQKNKTFLPLERMYHQSATNAAGKVKVSPFSKITFLGPYNCASRTRAILIDKNDTNLMFAGSTSGGLFRSINKASTWTPVNDQTIGLNVTCIIQNPFNPDIIYYGTGEHKNHKINSPGSGVYKSTDRGFTFAQLPATDTSSFFLINSIKHSLVDANTFYVATTWNGVYRSTDGGASFQTIFDNLQPVTEIECFPDGKIILASSFDGIYVSANGNPGSFVKDTAGLPTSGYSRIEVAYCDSFPLIVYSIFADSAQEINSGLVGVYRSSDGGISWNSVANPENVSYFPYGDFILAIAVKPDDSDFVFCGGGKLAFTNDGGQIWTQPPYNGSDQHVLLFDKFNTNLLYNGNDQGIWSFDLSNPSLKATNLNFTYNASQIWAGSYFPSGNNCLIGAQDNVFMKNSNDDPMFVRIPKYTIDGNFTHVNQQNTKVSYISGNFGVIYRSYTTDDSLPAYDIILNELDSNHDESVDDDVWHVNPFEMNLLDGAQLYLPTRDHIWRSINSGDNWVPITNSFHAVPQKPYALGISNAAHPKIYAGGTGGFFYRIDDAYTAVAGQEVDLTASVPIELINGLITCLAVQPLNDDIVYATVQDDDDVSKIWKITGGNSATPAWTDISGNLDKLMNIYWVEMDPDHADSILFVGTDYGLYSTIDAGATWSRETNIPMISVFQMRLRRSDKKLFVFTFGRGVWLAQLPVDNPSEDKDAHVNIFPNPSNGKYNLEVSKSDVEINTVTVSDLRGRIIRQINKPSDNKKISIIDLSDKSGGVYLLNIQTDNGQINKKLVKL